MGTKEQKENESNEMTHMTSRGNSPRTPPSYNQNVPPANGYENRGYVSAPPSASSGYHPEPVSNTVCHPVPEYLLSPPVTSNHGNSYTTCKLCMAWCWHIQSILPYFLHFWKYAILFKT